MPERELQLLSVVAPMLNEEDVAREFHRRVTDALDGLPFELVVVDDGSTDATPQILDDLAAADSRLRVVHLSRPFGHQLALTAGLDHARGDAVVMIDADLQDPPELIPQLLGRWREGADVVVARRNERPGEARWRITAIHAFYRLMSRLAKTEFHPNSGDFRLLDRQALDALLALRERNRFIRGMTGWVGFTHAVVIYDRDERFAGDTKYPLGKLMRLAMDGVASFSHVPLQMATYLGFSIATLAFLGLPLTIVARLSGIFERGVPTLLFVILFMSGIQLMTIGVIGEYLGRIYDEVKRRPLYVVRSRANVDEDTRERAAELATTADDDG